MTLTLDKPPKPARRPRKRRVRRSTSLAAHGEPVLWLSGGALWLCLAMIVGLLALVLVQGGATFWPKRAVQVTTLDGKKHLGELAKDERFEPVADLLAEDVAARAEEMVDEDGLARRRLVRTGNFQLSGTNYEWFADFELQGDDELPEWALVLERMSWGRFYGFPTSFKIDGEVVADTPESVWEKFGELHGDALDRLDRRSKLAEHEIGRVSSRQERARLAVRAAELESGAESDAWRAAQARFEEVERECAEEFARLNAEIEAIDVENERYHLVMTTAGGEETSIQLAEVVRAYPPNQLGLGGRIGVYFGRWWEFLTANPRDANKEGGVFPAIFGTVVMTLLMSVLVLPFGVLAALYLREYAKQGLAISAVRIAVNNLAGVPSIVFGVFGLGFFCYIVGAGIDEIFFAERLPNPTYGARGIFWASLTLALLTLPVVIVATEEALAAVPNSMREGSYACGATKWQTIRRIVLPKAAPGIMTGMILAIARGAGEVAPLMLVGAAKTVSNLPIDGTFPFIHAERRFMHLGFHIYDLALQSQNSGAARPLVFTTTLLLIAIVVFLNLLAIWIRARLRRRVQGHI